MTLLCAFAPLRALFLLSCVATFIAATPVSSQTIYAVVFGNQKYLVGSSTLHSGLFRSTDLGKTWEHLGPENLKAFSMDAVDTSKGRILYIAAGNGVHRSTDYGKTWKIVTDWRMTEVLDVAVDQSDPRWVYAATAWGLWRSSDGGDTWEEWDGMLKDAYTYRIQHSINPRTVISHGMKLTTLLAKLFICSNYGLYCLTQSNEMVEIQPAAERIWKRPDPVETTTTHGFYTAAGAINVRISSTSVEFSDEAYSRRGCGIPNSYRGASPRMSAYDATFNDSSDIYIAGDSGIWKGSWVRSCRPLLDWDKQRQPLPTQVVHAIIAIGETNLAGTWGDGIYRRENDQWVASGLQGSQVWRLVVKEY